MDEDQEIELVAELHNAVVDVKVNEDEDAAPAPAKRGTPELKKNV